MPANLFRIDASGEIVQLQRGSRLLGRLLVLTASQYHLHRQRLRRTDRIGQKATEQKLRHEQSYADHTFLFQVSAQSKYAAPSLIWVWPRSHSTNAAFRHISALPEPLCRKPMINGVRTVRGLEGYFGEVWRESLLIAIRWWSEPPTRRQWKEFIRATGLRSWTNEEGGAYVDEPPQPIDVPFRSDLVFGSSDWAGRAKQFRAASLLIPVIAVAALFIAFDVGQAAGLQVKIADRHGVLKLREESAATWLPYRQRALQARNDIARLVDQRESIAVVYALIDLSYALKDQSVKIRSVDLIDDRISVAFDKPGLTNPVSIIESLERSVSWQTVSYDNNRQQIMGKLSTRLLDQESPTPTPNNEE